MPRPDIAPGAVFGFLRVLGHAPAKPSGKRRWLVPRVHVETTCCGVRSEQFITALDAAVKIGGRTCLGCQLHREPVGEVFDYAEEPAPRFTLADFRRALPAGALEGICGTVRARWTGEAA